MANDRPPEGLADGETSGPNTLGKVDTDTAELVGDVTMKTGKEGVSNPAFNHSAQNVSSAGTTEENHKDHTPEDPKEHATKVHKEHTTKHHKDHTIKDQKDLATKDHKDHKDHATKDHKDHVIKDHKDHATKDHKDLKDHATKDHKDTNGHSSYQWHLANAGRTFHEDNARALTRRPSDSGSIKSLIKGFGLTSAKRDLGSPLETAGPFSKLTLWWLNKHMWRGFRRPLSPQDIYTVTPEERSVHRALRLDRYWDELTEEQKMRPGSLLKVTIRSSWTLLAIAILLMLLGEACKFAQPFLIAEIVSYFKGKYVSQAQAWGYAAGMVLLMVVYSILSTQGEFLGQVLAMRMRSSCTALLTRKATKLSSIGLKDLSTGLVINLLASDVEKFYNAASEFRGLFVGPVVLVVLAIIMSVSVELYILPALTFVILLTALRFTAGYFSSKLRTTWAERSDKRISMVTEVVASMRMVKAYCWEKAYETKLKLLRRKELKDAGLVMFLNGLNLNLGHICDRIVTFLLVLTIVLSGNTVDYKQAIQILVWMKMGQLGFLNFPVGYSMWKQMEASLNRIQEFLLGEEFKKNVKVRSESKFRKSEGVCIKLENASASWEFRKKDETKSDRLMKASILSSVSTLNSLSSRESFVASGTFSLRNISMHLRNGEHVGLVGPIGSGKTSLIMAILGNLPITHGSKSVHGSFAYVPQEPWIRGDTVRNNILMGEKMDRKRYSTVLKACALDKDISAMKEGDLTMVGDKGSTLSGGQKARISLARAIFKNADIYILDDPVSSLDAKVTIHVYQECIEKLLKEKVVLVSTNNLQLLHQTNYVVALREGKIQATGKLEDVKKEIDMNDFLSTPMQNLMDKEEPVDIFEKHDKKDMLMSLFNNSHIKKEHAHVPSKRTTPLSVYVSYWMAGYGYITMVLFCVLLLAQQAFSILGEWWMVYNLSGGYAGKKDLYKKDPYPYNLTHDVHHPTEPSHGHSVHNASFIVLPADQSEINFAAAAKLDPAIQQALVGPYAAFIWTSFVLGILSVVMGTAFTVMAANNLYNKMFRKILHGPMKIFAADNGGEMVNRFARDTGRMDDIIPITINSTFLSAAIIVSHTFYICVINYYVVLASIPFFALVVIFTLYCVRAIRDTKRIESEFRTPTFKHIQHLLDGLEVIRAFGIEGLVIKEADNHLDRHTSAWHLYIGSMYWMKMRLNLMVTLYLAGVLIIALVSPKEESMATPLGLSLSYILVFMGRIQYCAMYSVMLDANMTSVEHISEYSTLEQEESHDTDASTRMLLPQKWPEIGGIKFSNVNLIYPGSRVHALVNFGLSAEGREKIGIVGRTGAGKSTIFNVLLRMYYYTGTVTIDGVNIRGIGLHDLRNHITLMLQEPVLHTGTVRYNLDPFTEYNDEQIWKALEKVQLKKKISRLPGQLNMEIEVDGTNFSAGQKQLLCMARALLNMKKLMVLDEITASVDIETARLIDKMLTEEFVDCTILHISHDLAAIMHYDKVLIVESGMALQFDHPHILLQDKNGPFYSLVRQLGSQMVSRLEAVAKESFSKRRIRKTSERKSQSEGVIGIPLAATC